MVEESSRNLTVPTPQHPLSPLIITPTSSQFTFCSPSHPGSPESCPVSATLFPVVRSPTPYQMCKVESPKETSRGLQRGLSDSMKECKRRITASVRRRKFIAASSGGRRPISLCDRGPAIGDCGAQRGGRGHQGFRQRIDSDSQEFYRNRYTEERDDENYMIDSSTPLNDGETSTTTITTGGLGAGNGVGLLPHQQRSLDFLSPLRRRRPPKRRQNTESSIRTTMSNTAGYLKEQVTSFFQLSDNKLAMKLFGNKNALMKEKMRLKNVGHWIIHPCSKFRFYWDVFMLILLLINLIVLPVCISFFNDDLSSKWLVFNGFSDTFFLIDLIINFRTGIMVKNYADEIILEPWDIARHYLRSWFILDFVSSLPLDYVILLAAPDDSGRQFMHAGRAFRMFRLVKLLSLLRLLRLSRLVRYLSQWEDMAWNGWTRIIRLVQSRDESKTSYFLAEFFLSIAGMFMRIFNLIGMMLLMGHWNGCLQFLIPMLQDFPPDSWVALNELQNAPVIEQYTWSLFKALSHMLSIGYGRFPPQCISDVWLTIISMVTGATFYALFVGHSTTLIQSFDTSKRLYEEKCKQVEEYMISRNLPRQLRRRITTYYGHRFQGKMFDEQSILGEVNECLKEEIISYNCRALVQSVPFFSQADESFVTDVVTKLQHEVFLPGDVIIREGSVGTKMYFIQEGIVDIINKLNEVITSLSDGSYFGEISLLRNGRRVATVRAESYCNLYSLSADQFLAILGRYPSVRRNMETVVAQRMRRLATGPPPPRRSSSSIRRWRRWPSVMQRVSGGSLRSSRTIDSVRSPNIRVDINPASLDSKEGVAGKIFPSDEQESLLHKEGVGHKLSGDTTGGSDYGAEDGGCMGGSSGNIEGGGRKGKRSRWREVIQKSFDIVSQSRSDEFKKRFRRDKTVSLSLEKGLDPVDPEHLLSASNPPTAHSLGSNFSFTEAIVHVESDC